jgi:hypothetical protein
LIDPTHIVVNTTGFFVHGRMEAYNVILCSVKAVLVDYRFTNGSFNVLTMADADLHQTRRIATMLDTGDLAVRVPNAVDGVGYLAGDYISSFAVELSRGLAAMSASIYEPGEVSDIVQLVPGIGTKFQLAPLVLLVVTLLVYRCVLFVLMN